MHPFLLNIRFYIVSVSIILQYAFRVNMGDPCITPFCFAGRPGKLSDDFHDGLDVRHRIGVLREECRSYLVKEDEESVGRNDCCE